jgi:hypothetical protein
MQLKKPHLVYKVDLYPFSYQLHESMLEQIRRNCIKIRVCTDSRKIRVFGADRFHP